MTDTQPEKKPQCLSILVADSVRQERNGKLLIVGVYTRVKLKERPEPGSLHVFTIVRSIPVGTHDIAIKIIDQTSKKVMITEGPSIEVAAPNELRQMGIEIRDFSFPSSGSYKFQLLIDGNAVGEHIVNIEFPQSDDIKQDEQEITKKPKRRPAKSRSTAKAK